MLKCLKCGEIIFKHLEYTPDEKIHWSVCSKCDVNDLNDLQLQILTNEVKAILLTKGIDYKDFKIVKDKPIIHYIEKEYIDLDI